MKKAKPIENLAELAILSRSDVQRLTNLGHTQLWKLEKSGEFPKRIRLSALRVGWRSDQVRDWILSRPVEMAYFSKGKRM